MCARLFGKRVDLRERSSLFVTAGILGDGIYRVRPIHTPRNRGRSRGVYGLRDFAVFELGRCISYRAQKTQPERGACPRGPQPARPPELDGRRHLAVRWRDHKGHHFGLAEQQIFRMRKGGLPYMSMGRAIRFYDAHHVAEYLENHKRSGVSRNSA
jgi:hypothetical protein